MGEGANFMPAFYRDTQYGNLLFLLPYVCS
jgi:hypothetical protein